MDVYNEKRDSHILPLITVIVPVYNAELYLARCVDSITKQTYKNLEIILVNDGSSDSSEKLCEKLALSDGRIKVIHQHNGGSSIARNSGLKASNGEFIGFVDSDDWIELNMLETMVGFALKSHLSVVECGIIRSTIYDKGTLRKYNEDQIETIETREKALERIIANQSFAVWRRIYHRSVIDSMSFIPHKIHQDVFFTIDVLKKVENIGFIDMPLYIYYVENNNSIIRGNYNIQKLRSIDAGIYVVENTGSYGERIRNLAKKYVIIFLSYNYNSIFLHGELDGDYYYRKHIKKTIKENLSMKSYTIYGLIISILPFYLYKIFLNVNMSRISLQRKFLKFLKNV